MKRVTFTLYSTWCIMICLVIPILSLLLFIQSLYSLSKLQFFFIYLYDKSKLRWVDSELFLIWMKRVFLEHVFLQRPVVLCIGGHKSHMTLDLINLCRTSGVILFCLPLHTTYALQPLDVAVFKSLKDNFFKSVRALHFTKKNFTVSKREFASVVKGLFEKAFSMSNVKASFPKTGIYPNAIGTDKMKPSEFYTALNASGSSSSSRSHSTSAEASVLMPDAITSGVIVE